MSGILQGLTVPFIGTALGAACVFFLKDELNVKVREGLAGFAAGVMTAASVWSLIIPSIERCASLGTFAFVPAVTGFLLGMLSMLALENIISRINRPGMTGSAKNTVFFIAVTLHNIPEGMAVGVLCADLIYGGEAASSSAASALALGIAIQNFPEGAIISMPLKAEKMSRKKAFFWGVISGAAEPLGAVLTIFAAGFVIPLMPYFLSFAAGAMVFVVIAELVPEMSEKSVSGIGIMSFAAGFSAMMTLDVMLG